MKRSMSLKVRQVVQVDAGQQVQLVDGEQQEHQESNSCEESGIVRRLLLSLTER